MKRFAIALILASPLLRGAGCTAHYGAHLNAELTLPQSDSTAPILVKYRLRQQRNAPACAPDMVTCLQRHKEWRSMRTCSEKLEFIKVPAQKAQTQYNFEICTGLVGVNYQADVLAFLDTNENGQLDVDEPYGLYAKNPLTRDTEPQALSIKLDQRLKPAPSP